MAGAQVDAAIDTFRRFGSHVGDYDLNRRHSRTNVNPLRLALQPAPPVPPQAIQMSPAGELVAESGRGTRSLCRQPAPRFPNRRSHCWTATCRRKN